MRSILELHYLEDVMNDIDLLSTDQDGRQWYEVITDKMVELAKLRGCLWS